MTRQPVPVLVNPRSGRTGGASVRQVERAIEAAEVPAVVRAVDGRDLEQEIRGLVEAGAPIVAVAGGDGSMLTAAGVLAGTPTALVPLPTGTLNHFAKKVGIGSLEDGAASIAHGRSSRLPVGIVDDRTFLNTATFGLYADVVRRREALRRWFGKWPAAGIGFASRIAGLRQLDLTLEVGEERITRRTPLVWIGLGWGSFPLVHEATERRGSPDLEIVILRPSGRWGALTLLGRLSLAIRSRTRPLDDPALEFLHARKVLIYAEHRVGTTLDGEMDRLATPIYVGVQDQALAVIAPPVAAGPRGPATSPA